MGNTSTVQQLEVAIPSYPGEWKQQMSLGHCLLVKNVQTGTVAEQYSIPSDPRIDKMQDYWIYEMRRTQTDNIVTVYQVQKEDNQYLCQGQDYLRVKTQHIPYRLSQISNISFAQSIYILKQALIGYRAIADFCGPIKITDEMIGFTPQHKVKVWLNQNFASNLPAPGNEFQFRQHSSLQQRDPNTIALVFDVIEEHINGGQFPDNFAKAFRQYPMQTFSQALQFVEEYSSKQRIQQRESLKKQVNFINHNSNLIVTQPIIQQNPLPVAIQPKRYYVQDPPKKYYVEPTINRSKLQVKPSINQILVKQPKNEVLIYNQPRVISQKHQLPKQYYYQPQPLKLLSHPIEIQKKSRNPFLRVPEIHHQKPTLKYSQKSFKKSDIVIQKQPNYNHQYVSMINMSPSVPSSIYKRTQIVNPNTQFSSRLKIYQSQINIRQPEAVSQFGYQKQSVTTVNSQSSLINSHNPIYSPQQYFSAQNKNLFIKKPKNITTDSIPFRYPPKSKLNFLSPRK